MSNVFQRIKRLCSSERAAGLLFGAACLTTFGIAALPQGSSALPNNPTAPVAPPLPNGNISVTGKFSQGKVVQNADGTVFMEVLVDPPAEAQKATTRTPVDMIVVLDHSGSMSEQNRLPYAKSAISSLLSRLGSEDRFGLVTFESAARIVSPLTPVTNEFRAQEQRTVAEIAPAGSTNLSGGLELAQTMLTSGTAGRIRKVILLSDGEANVGIIDNTELAKMARGFGAKEAILSTIGMGLNFNEVLMASLADNGMGNYTYLENLAGLDKILDKDLQDTRAVYAAASSLDIKLPSGFQILDNSGYPQESGPVTGSIRLLTGQLVSGVRKSIFITLKAPTDKITSIGAESVSFNWVVNGNSNTRALDAAQFALTVVPQSQEAEALASVDKDTFRKGWATNAMGRVQKEFSADMKAGNAVAAQSRLEKYRRDVGALEARTKVKVLDEQVADSLSIMEGQINEVQNAPAGAKEEAQKRVSKQAQATGIRAQH